MKRAAFANGMCVPPRFTGDEDGHVRKLHGVRLGPGPDFAPVEGGEFTLDADLVLIAIGFAGAVREGLAGAACLWSSVRAARSSRMRRSS